MTLIPQTILGRTLAVMLTGIVLVGAIMASQMYVERQALLTNIGGWHVVSRISGVIQAVQDADPRQRRAVLRTYQGPAFRVMWSPQSPLPPQALNWQGRMVKGVLEQQLGKIEDDALRIGQTTLRDRLGPAEHMHTRPDANGHARMVVSLRLDDGS